MIERMWIGLLALMLAGPAAASDVDDLIAATARHCAEPLAAAVPLGAGLTRASAAMEAKLLDGKAARILRTGNPKVVIVAHDSGQTCEVMGMGIRPSEFAPALSAYAAMAGWRIAPEAKLADDGPGGAYLARKAPPGYLQMFVHTEGSAGFVFITASRVADSVEAREVLGE